MAHRLQRRRASKWLEWGISFVTWVMADVLILDGGDAGAIDLAGPLQFDGHTTVCAGSGEDAAAQIRRRMPDMIVVGMDMIGRPWMPIVNELENRQSSPTIVIYWNGIEPKDSGDPHPFGRCVVVARGRDWNQTRNRLMQCLPDGAPQRLEKVA